MLKVLDKTLTPKVSRADMSVLRNDLPLKKEFVITVPLTDLQKKAYSLYVRSMKETAVAKTKSGDIQNSTIWHWLTMLSLICNHPKCFDTKIRDRKDEARKDTVEDAPSPGDDNDNNRVLLDINAPAWKIGVSQKLVDDATKLFREEAPDLESVDLSYKVQILCQILDASNLVGDKTLVFTSSIPTLDYLELLCKKQGRVYARLDGKTPMDKRQGMSKRFNTGNTDVMLISTTAGGLGLNLPGANRVIIFDFKFNPIMEEQAVGRAYRIGQKKPTFVYRFVAGGTFEDHIHNKTVFKMQLAKRVVDKKTPVAYATRNLSEFLFEPREVEQTDLSKVEGVDPSVLNKILARQRKSTTICKIVEDDTFEKDDEDKLTAEEEKEATRLFKEETMRRTDPAKWQELQAKRTQRAYEASVRAQQEAEQRFRAQRQTQQNSYQQVHQHAHQQAQQAQRVGGPAVNHIMADPQPQSNPQPANSETLSNPQTGIVKTADGRVDPQKKQAAVSIPQPGRSEPSTPGPLAAPSPNPLQALGPVGDQIPKPGNQRPVSATKDKRTEMRSPSLGVGPSRAETPSRAVKPTEQDFPSDSVNKPKINVSIPACTKENTISNLN